MTLLKLDSYQDANLEKWAWPNFSPYELRVRGGPVEGSIILNLEAADCLQELRTALGKPIVLLSAGRDPVYNEQVGGADKSMHLKGEAFDCLISGHAMPRFVELAQECGFTGIGYYESQGFVHIDTGRERSWGAPFEQKG